MNSHQAMKRLGLQRHFWKSRVYGLSWVDDTWPQPDYRVMTFHTREEREQAIHNLMIAGTVTRIARLLAGGPIWGRKI